MDAAGPGISLIGVALEFWLLAGVQNDSFPSRKGEIFIS